MNTEALSSTLAQLTLLGPLMLFIFISSITPGPNNMMLTASGLNFGLRRTWPHLWGVNLGFALMVAVLGLGMGAVFARFPLLHLILKYLSAAYLLWLAWKIAHASPQDTATQSRPFTFLQAALFQWVNPKAWAMATGLISAYVPPGDGYWGNLGIAILLSLAINLPCIVTWATFGSVLRRWLHRPAVIRGFNWTMALLLVVSLAFSLLPEQA